MRIELTYTWVASRCLTTWLTRRIVYFLLYYAKWMDPLALRVALRFATRPVWLDKQQISTFVEGTLVPSIRRWLKRRPNQDEPIGAVSGIAHGSLVIDAADSRGTVDVNIVINAVESKGKWASVLGGSLGHSGKTAILQLNLNGALSAAEYLSEEPLKKRFQPLHSCTYETCVPYGLYSIMIHELTHAADMVFPHAPINYYHRGPHGEVVDLNMGAYINDPLEVRAFMQQVADEVLRYAKNDALRPHIEKHKDPNQKLIDLTLKLSTTWKLIEAHLSPANKARILKGVYDRLDQAGLLFDTAPR